MACNKFSGQDLSECQREEYRVAWRYYLPLLVPREASLVRTMSPPIGAVSRPAHPFQSRRPDAEPV